MGVGAVFISTLAITELPRPNDPPASQNELLAASLHPIVSFIVLGSIIIRKINLNLFYEYLMTQVCNRRVVHTGILVRKEVRAAYCLTYDNFVAYLDIAWRY